MGNVDGLIVKLNVSFASNKSLSIIEILNGTLISPAEIVTLNGPDL